MSASGKSSNRAYEDSLGYAGGGHGVYAAEGNARYRREQRQMHLSAREHNTRRCPLCPGPSGDTTGEQP
jgi:hypothetical protein